MKLTTMVRISLVAAIATTPVVAGAATTDPGYTIHPGDQLSISVYGEPSLTQTVTVLPDSTIAYPMIGRVSLLNDTTAKASDAIRDRLARYIRQPIVSVAVSTVGQLTVMVLGNVKTPGKYTLPYNSHATDAIAAAGGMGPTNGDLPVARVSDPSGVQEASLEQILRHGDLTGDPLLHDDSIVYVPSPATFDVQVVGAVDHPGQIPLDQGDRLSAAIAKAGNSANANADLNNIRVTRVMPDGTSKVFEVNLYQELQHGDASADIALQKNDVVYVPQAKKPGSSTTMSIFSLLLRPFGFGF